MPAKRGRSIRRDGTGPALGLVDRLAIGQGVICVVAGIAAAASASEGDVPESTAFGMGPGGIAAGGMVALIGLVTVVLAREGYEEIRAGQKLRATQFPGLTRPEFRRYVSLRAVGARALVTMGLVVLLVFDALSFLALIGAGASGGSLDTMPGAVAAVVFGIPGAVALGALITATVVGQMALGLWRKAQTQPLPPGEEGPRLSLVERLSTKKPEETMAPSDTASGVTATPPAAPPQSTGDPSGPKEGVPPPTAK